MKVKNYLLKMLILGIFVVCLRNSAFAEDPLPSMIIGSTGWITNNNGIVEYYTVDFDGGYRDLNTSEKAYQLSSINDLYDEGNEIWIPASLEESATITCNCHGYVFLGVSSWTGSGWIGNGVFPDPTPYLTSGEYSINNISGDVCRFSGHSAYHSGLGEFVYWAKMSTSAPWAYHTTYGEGGAYGPHYQRWCKNP